MSLFESNVVKEQSLLVVLCVCGVMKWIQQSIMGNVAVREGGRT